MTVESELFIETYNTISDAGKVILLEELEKHNPVLHAEVTTIFADDKVLSEASKEDKGRIAADRVKQLNGYLEAAKLWDHLGYYKDRWADERQYEDFNVYILAIRKLIEEAAPGAKVTKITKGFKIYVTFRGVEIYYTVASRSITVKYKV